MKKEELDKKNYYSNSKLKYKAEYLNGKGKKYDYKGNLLFKGEYLNGKRKKYDYDYKSILKYTGEYIINGKGKYFKHKTYFNNIFIKLYYF